MEYKLEEIDPYGSMLFNRVFKIKIDPDLATNSEDDYEELALWCCKNLHEPFVLLVYKTRIVAGGSSDNENSYEHRKTDFLGEGGLISHYELRCDHKDAVLFKVRWA